MTFVTLKIFNVEYLNLNSLTSKNKPEKGLLKMQKYSVLEIQWLFFSKLDDKDLLNILIQRYKPPQLTQSGICLFCFMCDFMLYLFYVTKGNAF